MVLTKFESFVVGVYATDEDIKRHLSEKYGKLSASELQGSKEFTEDLMESDISMTIRLQVVYGRLSIRSVRSAFEVSVGSKLQKFGGSDNKELLQRWIVPSICILIFHMLRISHYIIMFTCLELVMKLQTCYWTLIFFRDTCKSVCQTISIYMHIIVTLQNSLLVSFLALERLAFEGYQIWSFFFSLSIFLFSSNALFGSKEGRDFNGGKGHLVWFEKGEEEKQSNYDYTHTVDK